VEVILEIALVAAGAANFSSFECFEGSSHIDIWKAGSASSKIS
jgi:hypothetical protein